MQYDERGRLKSIDFSPWGGLEGFLSSTSADPSSGHKGAQLKRVVPWLLRATSQTANAVASLPFEVTNEAGDVVDSSTEWKNVAGGMTNPKRLLKLLAGSLTGGCAYLIPEATEKLIIDLQYVAPHTITPYIDINGLQYFQRASDTGQVDKYDPEDIVYFWLPDSDTEIGPAKSHPLGTATQSADLLYSMDATLGIYGKRGFVPATILAAKGMPIEAKRIEMEAWWDRFLRGWTNVVAKIFNAETLSVERVGAGLEELKSVYIEITRQQIENIGAAFGIPAGLFLSDKAYATEMDVLTRQWYETGEFKAVYQTIEETMTEQVLARYGYTWTFKPETLDIYQEDENERAQAFSTYVNAGIKRSVAAEMLGIELPGEMTYEALDEAAEEAREQALEDMQAQQPPPTNGSKPPVKSLSADEIKELNLWRQIAERQFRKGNGAAVDFECKVLPDAISDQIRARLQVAGDEQAVVKAFELDTSTLTPMPEYQRSDIMALAESINKAAEFQQSASAGPVTHNVILGSDGEKLAEIISGKEQEEKAMNKDDLAQILKAITEIGGHEIIIPAPEITVMAPDTPQVKTIIPAPVVNIENKVIIPRVKKQIQKVKRDAKGDLIGSETTYEYEEGK
jgi:hypothetical protein